MIPLLSSAPFPGTAVLPTRSRHEMLGNLPEHSWSSLSSPPLPPRSRAEGDKTDHNILGDGLWSTVAASSFVRGSLE